MTKSTKFAVDVLGTAILGCLAGAGVALPGAAYAQGAAPSASDEIVVTAQKREQNIQDVGIAITALSGDDLAERGITSTDALAGIPGVYVSTFNAQTTTTLTIRGVNQNDFADHNEPPNAVYVDGAYNSFVGGAGFAMFDVERVEVLRGPQGTLFGRNATGGLLHVITRKPTDYYDGFGQLNVGEHNLVSFEGAVSGPLADGVNARFSLYTNQHDGYVKNTLGGELQGADNLSGRLQVEFAPTDGFNLLLNLHGGRDDVVGSIAYEGRRAIFDFADPAGLVFNPQNNAQFIDFCTGLFDGNTPAPLVISATSTCSGAEDPALSDPYVTALDNPGFMRRETHGATVTANVDLSDSVTLTSVTDYLKLTRDASEDTDGTMFRLFNFYSDVESDQFSQEVRLQGAAEAFDWVAGVYYLKINHDVLTGIDAVPDDFTLNNANPDVLFPFLTANAVDQETTSWAVFAQGEWRFAERWSGILGLRWSEDEKAIDIATACGGDIFEFTCALVAPPGSVQGDGFSGEQSVGDYSAKFELDYRPTDDLLIYAGVTRGQKGGGFNAAAINGIPASVVSYDPEVLLSYEAGFKSTIWGGTTDLNASAFYYDYTDYQAFTLTGLTPTVFNTDAEVTGAEIELRTSPADGLDLTVFASYLDAIALDVPANLVPPPEDRVILGEQRIPQAPEWSFGGSARYEWTAFGGQMALAGDANYVGERYFNTVNHPALQDDAYTIVNARASFSPGQDEKWEFALWGRNLTDETFASTGFDLSGTDGVATYTVSPPRWFGGSIAYRW